MVDRPALTEWPFGEGAMVERIRTYHWETTTLGPLEHWPHVLRTAVDIMLAMSSPATILWGSQHVQLYNDAYVPIARDRHPLLLGRPVAEGWPDAYDTVIAPLLENARKGRATQLTAFPVPLLGPNGLEERVFDTDWVPIRDEFGAVAGILQTLAEASDRIKPQMAVRETEAQHSLLIESWAQAVWETDPNGVVIADSPSWRAYTGQTLDEWLGYGWLDAIHPEDRSNAERQWREATAARALVDAEFRLRDPDGGWRWTNVRAAPVLDAKGDIEKWAGINMDIDARKRAEALLRESEQRYRRVFSNNMVPMAVWEKSGDITEANDALLELLGYTRAELEAGKLRWDEITPAQYRELDIQAIAEVEATGFCTPYEKVFCHKDGTAISIIIGGGSLDEKAGTGVLFAIDMTARRRAEAALRKNEDRQAFQLRLSDALASLSDPADIQVAAARLVAEQLGVSWCYFNEFDDRGTHAIVLGDFHREGLASMVGVHDLSDERDFLDLMCSGAMLDIPDLTNDELFSAQVKARYGAMGLRSVLGAPLLRSGHLASVFVVAGTSVRRWTRDDSELLKGVAERTWAAIQRARAQAALDESEERQRVLIEGVPQLVWRARDTGEWTWSSPQWEDFTGQKEEESRGWGWMAPLHTDDRQRAREAWAQAFEKGIFEADYRIRGRQGAHRWFQTRAKPIRDESGTIIEWLGTSTDVDDLRSLQERQRILVAELQHRTFNLMSMVTFMADATIRSTASLDEFSHVFGDRMAALARVQRLLSRLNEGDRITFDELVRSELEAVGAFEGSDVRVKLDGPEGVLLRTSTVQTFALALHELTTNAVKYGALKQPGAHLDVCWRVEIANEGERWLHVDWIETGVLMPASEAKSSGTGQGRSLIEGALPYQLKAKTTFVMADDGIRCSIALPVPTRTLVDIEDDAE